MKFQNPSFKFCLNGRTNERTSRKQYAPHFFKVRGIIISIFKEDNVFSMSANLPYGPPVNTDIDYFSDFFL